MFKKFITYGMILYIILKCTEFITQKDLAADAIYRLIMDSIVVYLFLRNKKT